MNKRRFCFLAVFLLILISIGFQSGKNTHAFVRGQDSLSFKTSPPLSPEDALSKMIVEEGFEVKLVASEPLISAPVALNFDEKGRIWVLEMNGYMLDAEGNGEETPIGKVVILEDKDGNGVSDSRKVFLDSLVLPRALCLVENGLLVAEPPKLWFYEINNDKPGNKILVDDAYTEGGNVEAQANGLYRAMDNWIYSGGSEKRYRKKGGKWVIERTHLRGQWGISQDNYGRLYYNNNSQNLLGDYFEPGLGTGNENLQRVSGFNERLVMDNRVYPARPTSGVNRGYRENVLDKEKRLTTFTAACGPLLYRGALFSGEYHNNVFVAEPAANLIKRNILEEKGIATKGRQAYAGKEFLSSVDERFRPVSLYDGPDGALYIVDMYRGIIQHKSFLTDYLKKEIQARALAKPVNYGRIYKVVPKNKVASSVLIPADPLKVAEMLQHPNGWIRDKAQQVIIDKKLIRVVPQLRRMLRQQKNPLAVYHALWTLEGLGQLNQWDILRLLEGTDLKIRIQALNALPSVSNQINYRQFVPVLFKLIKEDDPLLAPYLAFQIRAIKPFAKVLANDLLLSLAGKYPADMYVADAVISNLKGEESVFYKEFLSLYPDSNLLITKQLRKVLADIEENKKNRDVNLLRKEFPRGASLFRSTCQPCHGTDGNGIVSLAPPLNHSEWVTGDKNKLISIVLFGLSGPITVNGKLYRAPEISNDMPGIGNNKDVVDEDIAQLLSFIRRSWSNNAERISREDVIKIRRELNTRDKSFTAEEISGWQFK